MRSRDTATSVTRTHGGRYTTRSQQREGVDVSGMIRNENELLTLRIRLAPGRDESLVIFDFYRGRNQLRDPIRVPAEHFGIPPSMTYTNVVDRIGYLFPGQLVGDELGMSSLVDPLHALVQERSPEEPLWLQVSHGSTYLSVVPWEAVLRALVDPKLPVFRIPNFLIDPHFLVEDLEVALCASSPRAKISYESVYIIEDLVQMFSGLAPNARVHVFADSFVYEDIAGLARDDGAIKVEVHNPADAADFGLGGTRLQERSGGIASPWLLWMKQDLGERRTDLVHFVSPGYFTTDLGGLALAHSPLGDQHRRQAHMVSAAEINTFLNAVGAWAAGCTIPVRDPWSVGVRGLRRTARTSSPRADRRPRALQGRPQLRPTRRVALCVPVPIRPPDQRGGDYAGHGHLRPPQTAGRLYRRTRHRHLFHSPERVCVRAAVRPSEGFRPHLQEGGPHRTARPRREPLASYCAARRGAVVRQAGVAGNRDPRGARRSRGARVLEAGTAVD